MWDVEWQRRDCWFSPSPSFPLSFPLVQCSLTSSQVHYYGVPLQLSTLRLRFEPLLLASPRPGLPSWCGWSDAATLHPALSPLPVQLGRRQMIICSQDLILSLSLSLSLSNNKLCSVRFSCQRVCSSACIPLRRQLGLCWPQLWKWLKLQIVAAKFSGRRNLNGGKPPRLAPPVAFPLASHLNCTHISSSSTPPPLPTSS